MAKAARKRAVKPAKRTTHYLEAWRRYRDLSQEDLAERAGVHYTTIGKAERGTQWPTEETVIKVASALRLDSVADLFRDPRDEYGAWAFCGRLASLSAVDRERAMELLETFIDGLKKG